MTGAPSAARNGVYAAPAATAETRAALERAGGRWVVVDLAGVRDKAALIGALARALAFPAGFGGNWDALADSIEDLSWLATNAVAVELRGADALAAADAPAWRTALDILRGAATYWRRREKVFVVFADRVAGLPRYERVSAAVYKRPVSVLVVIYTPALDVLLLERADRAGFWQSVTGSQDAGESLRQTAVREVAEETGIDAERYALTDWEKRNRYEIYPHWRHRYEPGVTHNTEHVFGLAVPERVSVRLAPREHTAHVWLPWQAAVDKVFSWSNADAIRELPARARVRAA